jgi:hypothetical protein
MRDYHWQVSLRKAEVKILSNSMSKEHGKMGYDDGAISNGCFLTAILMSIQTKGGS